MGDLLKAGFSPQEIKEYEGLQTAGFSTSEIQDYYMKQGVNPSILAKIGYKLESTARTAVPYIRPVTEIAGGVMGGVVGAASPIPGGALIGAGLGTAMGSQVANIAEQAAGERQPGTIPQEATRVATDIVMGAGAEAGGQVISKGINAIGKWLKPYAETWYGSAVKTPMGKFKELYRGHEGTGQMELVGEGLKREILPNKYGLKKTSAQVEDMTKVIHGMVEDLTRTHAVGAPYKGRTIPKGVQTSVSRITEGAEMGSVEGKIWASGESDLARKTVGAIKEDVVKKAGMKSTLNPNQLLAINKQFADEVAWEAKNPIINVKGQFTQEAKKAMSEAAMNVLKGFAPEIKYLSEKSSTMINLKKAIEYTIDRDMAKDMVGATSKMLSLKNMGLAIMDNVLGYSTNKARIAFALNKGAEWQARKTSRGIAYIGARGVRNEQMSQGEEK